MALIGILTVLALAWLLSTARGRINYRTISIAFAIQAALAAIIIYLPAGQVALGSVVRGVQHVINYANDGIEFVFGAEVTPTLGFTIAVFNEIALRLLSRISRV